MNKKLEWIEVMRGLAAMWVVFHHADLSATHFFPKSGERLTILSNGFLGVDFFFILSGFIIAYSSNKMLELGKGWTEYAKLRLVRIYIPYLPIGLAMYIAYMILPSLSEGNRQPGLLSSIVLFPTDNPPALNVAWTLIHELIFYFIFSFFFISRKLIIILLAIWGLVISMVFFLSINTTTTSAYFLSPLNLNFILGVSLYYFTRKGISNHVAVFAALSGIALVLVDASQSAPTRWLSTIGFIGLISASLSELASRYRPFSWLMILGTASYSIYLFHLPALSALVRFFSLFTNYINGEFVYILLCLCSLTAGLLYYYLYEKNALKMARKHFFSIRRSDEFGNSIVVNSITTQAAKDEPKKVVE